MPSASPDAARLDLGAALRQTLRSFWADFAPIVVLGFLLLTLPSLLLHSTVGEVPAEANPAGGATDTVMETLVAVLAMIYVSAVNYGVMCTLAGRQLDTSMFIWAGLRASRPGLLVALVLGSLVMAALILLLLFGRGSPLGWVVATGVGVALVVALVTWLVAVPVAVAERRTPWDALKRSAALTFGNRGRLIGFVGAIALGLLPGIMLVRLFGPDVPFAPAAGGELFSPAMWIEQLFWLLAQGLLATAPAVIYAQLTSRK